MAYAAHHKKEAKKQKKQNSGDCKESVDRRGTLEKHNADITLGAFVTIMPI